MGLCPTTCEPQLLTTFPSPSPHKKATMFIDTHAHIYEEEFNEDIAQTIERAIAAGARKILLPPTNEVSTLKAVALAKRYPDICHPMLGLHPEYVSDDYPTTLKRLKKILEDDLATPSPQFVAIGEVGLDYYWDKTHKEEQQQAFITQIEWAATHNLPLMIHSRSANGDLLKCLKPWRDKLHRGGVFHCFSGSIEEARELLRFHPDFYLGIGGIITFKNSTLPQVVAQLPLERIVLETDSPYMAPVPKRGKRNEPSFIPYIIEKISQTKGVDPSVIERVTTHNAMKLFFPKQA